MTWQGIGGHDDIVAKFRVMLAGGRLASTFLFVGPAGVGKGSFAVRLAATLLCQNRAAAALDPCGICPACQQVAAGTHPDLLRVAKPADKTFIPLELFIGSKEKRMQEGLCHDISLKPFMGGRRVAIIDDADYLNEEGQLLAEDARGTAAPIGVDPDRIQRRSPVAHHSLARRDRFAFRPLSTSLVADLLIARGIVSDPDQANRLAFRQRRPPSASRRHGSTRAVAIPRRAWWHNSVREILTMSNSPRP